MMCEKIEDAMIYDLRYSVATSRPLFCSLILRKGNRSFNWGSKVKFNVSRPLSSATRRLKHKPQLQCNVKLIQPTIENMLLLIVNKELKSHVNLTIINYLYISMQTYINFLCRNHIIQPLAIISKLKNFPSHEDKFQLLAAFKHHNFL